MEKRLVALGKIVKPRGLKGDVKLLAYTDSLDRFKELESVFYENGEDKQVFAVEKASHNNKVVFLKFVGINSVEDAENLRGGEIKIEEELLKELPKDSYYHFDLIGLDVETDNGVNCGVVKDVMVYPTCDTLSIITKDRREILVPMLQKAVKNVDIKAGRITLFEDFVGELFSDAF